MAHFDSPKNRALWEKELAGLRQKKALAAKQEGGEEISLTKESGRAGEGRKLITFKELVRDVQEKRQRTVKKESRRKGGGQIENEQKPERIKGAESLKGKSL